MVEFIRWRYGRFPVWSLSFLIIPVALLALSSTAWPIEPTKLCMTAECHSSFSEVPYTHGPLAAGMCPFCHDTGGKPDNLPPTHFEVRKGPASDKCLLCHSEIQALLDLSSVHTPVADGECIDCHNPHGGNDPFFLKYPTRVGGGKRVAPVCNACHEPRDPGWFDDFHTTEATLDCVVCHNAHASSETFQLTGYVRNVYLKAALLEADALRSEGKLEASAEAYAKALEIIPGDIGALLLLGEVDSARKDWVRARIVYEKVLSLEEKNLAGLVGAAGAAAALEDRSEELAYLKRALEVNPEGAGLHLRVGQIYRERGQLQEASAQFSKVVAIEPDSIPAHRELVEVYEAMGMTRDAEEERKILKGLEQK